MRRLSLLALFASTISGLTAALVAEDRTPKAGQVIEYEIAKGVTMEFCWIPPGKAQLGSPKAERQVVWEEIRKDDKDEPDWLQSEAEEMRGEYMSKGFWLARYPVTQQEWMAVMDGHNPSSFHKGGPARDKVPADTSRFPVENVSWKDCQAFLEKLNAHSAVADLERVFSKRGKFVLPHEDEWEYACRGGKGNHQAYYFGNELNGRQANCDGTRPFGTPTHGPRLRRTSEVGSYDSKCPHPWGLCDIHGNIFQWCENRYNSGPENNRVARGGCWAYPAASSRAARRYGASPDHRASIAGCRVCFRPD
jgi:formylglycine-generating enzyme required for sulfatase activity